MSALKERELHEIESPTWTVEDKLCWEACLLINKMKEISSMEKMAQYIDLKWDALTQEE